MPARSQGLRRLPTRATASSRHLRARLVTLSAGLLAVAACDDPKIMGSGGVDPSRAGSTGAGSGGTGGRGGGGGPSGSGGSFTIPNTPDAASGSGGAGGSSGPGQGEECVADTQEGTMVPLDLLLLVDTSGSMEDLAGTRSKWWAVNEALQAFLKDPGSAGLGVGLQQFPPAPKACTSNADCSVGVCEQKGICTQPANVSSAGGRCNAATTTMCGFLVGLPCSAYGYCRKTGQRCGTPGEPCPGGIADDVCDPRPRLCQDTGPTTCQADGYQTLISPIADLPGAQDALITALDKLVPHGGTPLTPAVAGALAHLAERKTMVLNRKPVLVLATDGLPDGCNSGLGQNNTLATVEAALAAGAQGAAGAGGVPTYVVGVFAENQLMTSTTALNRMAVAGGTMTPFVLTAGEDLSQRFLAALNAIRGAALGCEFAIPAPKAGALDYGKVNVEVGLAGLTENLVYVESADRCDATRGGWYYDVPPTGTTTPSRVRLCEATCNKVKATAGASVKLRFGCKTIVD